MLWWRLPWIRSTSGRPSAGPTAASGPLSALRVGKTPYGMLPICARSYQPKANSAIEREMLEAIGWFRNHWERRLDQLDQLLLAQHRTEQERS